MIIVSLYDALGSTPNLSSFFGG